MSDQVQSTPTRSGLKTGLQLGVIAIAAALAVACGGGGVGSNSTGSYASGSVSGFGSIIVNGVRYDDSNASVSGDDDTPGSSTESHRGVKLGMEVEVESSSAPSCVTQADSTVVCTAVASKISHGTSLVGPVTDVTTDTTTNAVTGFKVLGQAVTVSETTVVVGGPVSSTTAYVEVHGLFDKATQSTTATRVEVKSSQPNNYRLRGVVTSKVDADKTALVGGQLVSFKNLVDANQFDFAALVEGSTIRVKLANTAVAGAYPVVKAKAGERKHQENEHNELEGRVASYVSVSNFNVNGITVDASSASFEGGVAGDLQNDVRVEVKGTFTNNVLVASKVEIKKARQAGQARVGELEFHWIVSTAVTGDAFTATSLDGKDTFTVKVATGVDLRKGLTLAGLTNGKKIEVHGYLDTDGTTVVVTRIQLES